MHAFFQFVLVFALITVIAIKVIRYLQEQKTQQIIEKGEPIVTYTPEEMEAQREENIRLARKSFDDYYEQLLGDKSFVNKDTQSLETFIINDEINNYDLEKLAYLNDVKVEMAGGWYPLTLDLIKELDKTGWNRVVGSIKEKFGELRFYADTEADDILEKYTEMSKHTCEICGKPGKHILINGWYLTTCEEHRPKESS